MTDASAAYAASRERLSSLVLSLGRQQLDQTVAACPAWSVKDLLAHVVGIARDMTTGNMAGVGSDEWTRGHVDAGRSMTVEDLVSEWAELSVQVEGVFPLLHPAMGGMTVADLVTHEHDARAAVAQPGARDTPDLHLALDSYARFFKRRAREKGLPVLRIETDHTAWTTGDDEPAATVKGAPFELFRSLAGRRTLQEIAALEWNGAAKDVFVANFSNYGTPEASIGE